MRCDEIRERMVELLYYEPGTPGPSPELRAHVDTCPACQKELAELTSVRAALKAWPDELPSRPVAVPQPAPVAPTRPLLIWRALKYAAAASVVILALLGLGNADIAWNKDGFSFKTRLLPGSPSQAGYYTKTQVRDLIQAALDDTEARMLEANRVMILQGLDTAEAERFRDLRLIEARLKGVNKN